VLIPHERHQREGTQWFSAVSKADLRKVLTLSGGGRGAPERAAYDDDVAGVQEHLWASRKPSKRAAELAFDTGISLSASATAMLKTYELMARPISAGTGLKAGLRSTIPPPSSLERACARKAC